MTRVYDGHRILEFEGEELAFSSSERPNSPRWVEFTLYRTAADGQYVLSRVGVSNVYHTPDCRFTERAHLEAVPWGQLEDDQVPCQECGPSEADFPLVCPEADMTWAKAYREPEALVGGLYKTDQGGARYMTAVARKLLERAALKDSKIRDAFQVEKIS